MSVGHWRKACVCFSASMMTVLSVVGGSWQVAGQTGTDIIRAANPPSASSASNSAHESAAPPSSPLVSQSAASEISEPSPHQVATTGILILPAVPGEYSYNASGRREPFAAIVKNGRLPGEEDQNLPPLQRIGLTELNLIGIIWGGFGYSAMVQAPDGKGYTIRQGTRIGPNHGTVSSITENAVIVHERFTDVYGNKQVREYVKLLHAKEGSE